MTLTGSCLCGAIAYAAESEPLLTCLCHCVDCQKWTGSAYTSNVVVPGDSFKVTKGDPTFYDVTGASGKNNRHFFCSKCGSSLFTKLDIMADKTILKAGSLDNGEANLRGKVDIEFYTKDRVTYLCSLEGAKQEKLFA
ncbi:Mss4-like protein [Aspergillus avenaceus]|uniref:Mss4-like protein n=1 Tax=Aspergillus avenaceus TaxID=36643 RepID=A0A5N6TVL4_ASPAV|nr:Mss4-like protein [Aspergillus avenaceus]